jgi:dynactin complex subunit
MRKIPDSLIALQNRQREHTITLVRNSIQELQEEGYSVTVKRLCERTGLSRSVFSKPHVKALMEDAMRSQRPVTTISEESLERQYAKILSQLEKSRRQKTELKSANIQLRETIQELRSECELLRGELHSLMRRHGMRMQEGGEKK